MWDSNLVTAGGYASRRRPSTSLVRAWPFFLAVFGMGCSSFSGPEATEGGECKDPAVCRDTPVPVPGAPAFMQISAGSYHTCGLTTDGTAWCWGGATGPGGSSSGGRAAPVPGGHRFTQIGAGRYHNCALSTEGIVHCWTPGETGAGFCGPSDCGEVPEAVGARVFQALAVGAQHSCALDLEGGAWCWGFNWMGETGSTRFGQTERDPIPVSDSLVFADIDANHGYTCALTVQGELYCWGWGDVGQLAVADRPQCDTNLAGAVHCSAKPILSSTADRFTGISAGPSHACALNDEQHAMCWGDNGQGQLGDSWFGVRFTPGPATDRSWSVIEPGLGITCGITNSGNTYCWGLNQNGQLGTGTALDLTPTPQQVAGDVTFTELSAGLGHVCALTTTGAAYCWGDNRALQLGG